VNKEKRGEEIQKMALQGIGREWHTIFVPDGSGKLRTEEKPWDCWEGMGVSGAHAGNEGKITLPSKDAQARSPQKLRVPA